MEEAVSSTPETILEEDELTQLYRTQPIFYENTAEDGRAIPRYREPKSPELKSWLAGVSGRKGNPFRQKVFQRFKENTDLVVVNIDMKTRFQTYPETKNYLNYTKSRLIATNAKFPFRAIFA